MNKAYSLGDFNFEDISSGNVSRNNEQKPSADIRRDDVNAKVDSYGQAMSPDGFFMQGGPTYKNRPVVWIWNNQYLTTTGVPAQLISQGRLPVVNDPSLIPPPELLDDYKSVYIAEKDIWTHHMVCPDLAVYNPVTIFLYSIHAYRVKQRGIRRTTFEGYAPAVEFYSPDYSLMAPMPDYRRTLYWNPNVKTDSKGEAKIEFYNNSTCRQLVISAEGITKDGRAVVYRQ